MLISPAPIAIPVNTANVPTEAVAAEALQRPKVPQPTSATDSTANKNPTEFSEQSKTPLTDQSLAAQDKSISEKEQSQQQAEDQKDQKSSSKSNNQELDNDELKLVNNLRSRDREVRAHEQAHAAVGGNLAGAPQLSFTTGPDGKRYAVAGEVSIDTSGVANDPAASIQKFAQVQRAALAPAEPSSQDRKIAAQASVSENEARANLSALKAEEQRIVRENSIAENDISEPFSTTESSSTEKSTSTAADNPVRARRQAAQLNQRIASSGALDVTVNGSQLSVVA